MQLIHTDLSEVKILQPTLHLDERGYFFESFNQKNFEQLIKRSVHFVQENQSLSRSGVLRGLHYQAEPHAQAKLVRCILGEIFDVAVDIRADSPTFGQWVSTHLNEENQRQMWIPEGFAHGFVTLSEKAIVSYRVTDYYQPEYEVRIKWDSELFKIKWPLQYNQIILSIQDQAL